jgi:hypothetical protein
MYIELEYIELEQVHTVYGSEHPPPGSNISVVPVDQSLDVVRLHVHAM